MLRNLTDLQVFNQFDQPKIQLFSSGNLKKKAISVLFQILRKPSYSRCNVCKKALQQRAEHRMCTPDDTFPSRISTGAEKELRVDQSGRFTAATDALRREAGPIHGRSATDDAADADAAAAATSTSTATTATTTAAAETKL